MGAIRLVLALMAAGVLGCAGRAAREEATSAGAAGVEVYRRGVVAADHRLASEAGLETLKRGGNAVDAAVATSFALSVVRPYSCGIGGGGFMIIHFRDDPTHGTQSVMLNYRETAPAAVTADYYERAEQAGEAQASTRGAKAVGVPGTVAGLLTALEDFGRLDRRMVMEPAIRLAEEGFAVDRHYVESTEELIRWFRQDERRRERFAFVWERFLKKGRVRVGDRIRLSEQAEALRQIAEHGAEAFYNGEIAEAVVEAMQRDGGDLSLQDLREYRVARGEPLRFEFQGRTFLSMPPPSSGGLAMAQALGILARIPQVEVERLAEAGSELEHAHLLTESMKHAFADRARWLGDPAFVEIPMGRLMSEEYLRERAEKVRKDGTLRPEEYGSSPPEDGGTSHLCVVDGDGNAVSCTETINLIFGSLVAVERFGFVLNDEMDDFLTRPGEPNAFGLRQSERNLPAPGKRPLSSMTPTIVLDEAGAVSVVAGGSGGPRIISGTMQVILNVLLRDQSALAAVARPRFHHQWMPDLLYVERELPTRWKEGLRERGHEVKETESVGNVQVIRMAGEGYDAASDPRKGGAPAGW